jgi:hypothetical protein
MLDWLERTLGPPSVISSDPGGVERIPRD